MAVLDVFFCWAWLCPHCPWCYLGACVDSPNGEGWEPVFLHLNESHYDEHRRAQLAKKTTLWEPFFWPTWGGPSGYWRIGNPIR